jgi:nucleotide-binding universal stress UspA family protein
MYKRILSAVNEFINSEMAARYAITLAGACAARLTLAFIAEKGISRDSFRRAEDSLKRLFVEGAEAGVEMESITGEGDPVRAIREIVKKEETDLVIASARREDTEKRFFIKTTPRALMLGLPCSVAVVRVVHMGMVHPRRILVPVSGGIKRIEERAFFVSMLAKGFDSKVIVFHSPRPVSRFLHGEIYLEPFEWEKRLPPEVWQFMESMKRYKIPHEKRVRPGAASKTITIEAASKRHDLIVMGASRRSLISSIIKGNPVEKVLGETPCDLIIFKPRHENT